MGEFIDIIEWTDHSPNTLVWRFPRQDHEIKNGAQLTVRESQQAILVNEGLVADVFGPGRYSLSTANLPILSTLAGWKYGFESPFKAEVYFVNMRQFTNLKWGTKNELMIRDAEFGMVSLRAFGTYTLRVQDPRQFVTEIVGTDGHFTVEEVSDQIRNFILTRFTDKLGEAKIPVLDLVANYNELSNYLRQDIGLDVSRYGLELSSFLIENISLPPALQEVFYQRSSMGILGDMTKYAQFQAAKAIADAANNPGLGGAGIGLGVGAGLGQQISQQFQQMMPPAAPAGAVPPPLPPQAQYFVALNGQQSGPYSAAQLSPLVTGRQLGPQTLVWKAGLPQWVPAAQLPELQGLFGQMPPPLPA